MDRDTLTACLADLDSCGVRMGGEFQDSNGDIWDVADVETALDELRADVNKLRRFLAWAKTIPSLEVEEVA